MSMDMKLSHRQQHILWATVRQYIATAEPVGSKSLMEEYNLDVSPATIRNAMGALERSGLLFQPHTSAGRIPSDSGYRIYVDQLMQPSDVLARQVDPLLGERLNWVDWSMEALLRGAAQILSTLSGYITLITMPQPQVAQLRHLQMVQVNPGQVLLIVVMDSYESYSTLIELSKSGDTEAIDEAADPDLLDRELQILSNFLNHQLRGRSLTEIAGLDWSELDREFQRYADLLKAAAQALSRRTQLSGTTQILMSGLAEVLRQPEFAETHQFQSLIQLLEEEQEQLWPLIFEDVDSSATSQRVMVRIGAENPLEPIKSCAIVTSTYYRGTMPVGSLGVLGPTRMIYDSAIPVVEAAADYLSQALSAQ